MIATLWGREGGPNMKSSITIMHYNPLRKWSRAALASESLFWRHIRISVTSWMGAGLKAKSLRGECVSEAPGRGSGGQKQQSREPGCFSESLGILPLPARDLWTRFHQLPSENKPGTVQRVCLSACWGNMASLHQQVAALGFILCGHPPSTFRKKGYSQGFNSSILYVLYALMEQQSAPWRNKMPHMWLGAADWTPVFAGTNQNVSSWQVLKAGRECFERTDWDLNKILGIK